MITVQLTEAEARLLRRMISLMMSDLRMEITKTDSPAFRAHLKVEKRLLTRVLEQLEVAGEAPEARDA